MAALGFPGTFQAGFTTGFQNIGAVQKDPGSATSGFPGTFQAGLTVGYRNIGAVQKDVASVTPSGDPYIGNQFFQIMGLGT